MARRTWFLALLVGVSLIVVLAPPAAANPPFPEGTAPAAKPRSPLEQPPHGPPATSRPLPKPLDQPNISDYLRNRERQRLLESGQTAEANALALSGTERVLVVLVEFTGTDTFTWSEGTSTWDPLGLADPGEALYDDEDNLLVGDCSNIITQTTVFTYTGPSHNQIPRPVSLEDRSGDSIWTEDFNRKWFQDFMFGSGVVISYDMEDGTPVHESFLGQSVADYYQDLSGGTYNITGDVVGWVGVPHSTWWYGADQCPGRRSPYDPAIASSGAIPGAGSARSLVTDALDAVNAISDTVPGFDWANYDQDANGIIDRLWLVHAGYGEEDNTTLLNRTSYGEASLWSHASSVTPPYSVTQEIAAGPYIMMPENGGMGVFAHEHGHSLGAEDLYATTYGETSAGFWTLMADDWTGYPIGFEPPATDPWHLDNWGWLEPFVAGNTNQVYTVTLGQASRFPGGDQVYRGAKIPLQDGVLSLAAPPWQGSNYWWGGKRDLANAMMTTRNTIPIPIGGATLTFDLAYDIEDEWDFLWIQASADGTTWETLTNDNTECDHGAGWIGSLYGFPDDLCGAGLGGFYGYSRDWYSPGGPHPQTEAFDLSAYAGQSVYLRFWYMTDWLWAYHGPLVDNITITGESTTLFSDDAESGDANWIYADPWQRSDGAVSFTHNIYLQWRNVGSDGGYDSALGEPRWRFGPANSGLLVWYNNNFYSDNEIYSYLQDAYSFGPKGRILVVDAHPEPYRDPSLSSDWIGAERTNVTTRSQMRDAPFTLTDTVSFTMKSPYVVTTTQFSGRPAVPTFHDGLGYYPGVADEGDGSWWNTVDWDASAVVPAKGTYSLAGGSEYPGVHAQFIENYLWYEAPWYGGTGGTGDPRTEGLQYGWHVQILDQSSMTATIKIWNSAVSKRLNPAPPAITASGVYTLTYEVGLHNEGGLDPARGTVTITVPNEATLVDYFPPDATAVDGQVTWARRPLTMSSWISFTAVAVVQLDLQQPNPITSLTASAMVFDGSTDPPESLLWLTPVRWRIYMPVVMK